MCNDIFCVRVVTCANNGGCVYRHVSGAVPKGLLTFLGSLYKEVAKTTPGTLVCRLERQTARKKKNLPSKNTVSSI